VGRLWARQYPDLLRSRRNQSTFMRAQQATDPALRSTGACGWPSNESRALV